MENPTNVPYLIFQIPRILSPTWGQTLTLLPKQHLNLYPLPFLEASLIPQVGLTHKELEVPCLGSGYAGLGTQSPGCLSWKGKGEIIFPSCSLIGQNSTKDKL